jgi:PadR family transcriptional regulator, regulatory protein PadR
MDIITRLEEAILIAIWKLQDKAYGVTINKSVSELLNKEYTLGALYYSLDQLLRKGLVAKSLKRHSQEKAGRSRTYYQLTQDGAQALQEARVCQNRLWKGIPEITFKAEESK